MPETPKDEAFLSRWSRRKQEGVAAPISDDDGTVAVAPESADAAAVDDDSLTDDQLLEKYELPDPGQMKSGDDFSVFMREAVPERLRRRALRVLWGSNPILANLDELVDYGEDYTDAATVIENMQTIYQVGKGAAWKFQAEQARIAEEEAAAEAEAAERRAHNGEPEPEAETVSLAEDDLSEEIDQPAQDTETSEEAEVLIDVAEAQPPRPSPMRFEFD